MLRRASAIDLHFVCNRSTGVVDCRSVAARLQTDSGTDKSLPCLYLPDFLGRLPIADRVNQGRCKGVRHLGGPEVEASRASRGGAT